MWLVAYYISSIWLAAFIPLVLIILLLRRYTEWVENFFGAKRLLVATAIWIMAFASFFAMGAHRHIDAVSIFRFRLYIVMTFISITVMSLPIKALQKN